jgi:hypothetical protein
MIVMGNFLCAGGDEASEDGDRKKAVPLGLSLVSQFA